eukprot:SAG11_NODE_24775_length_368_cov_0.907063_1_plen_20_part_10
MLKERVFNVGNGQVSTGDRR